MKNQKSIVLLILTILLVVLSCGEKTKKSEAQESETKTVMVKAPFYSTNDPRNQF